MTLPEPYYQDESVTILCGDGRTVLSSWLSESVNYCVTSPPYWRLRDYGTASWDGGDDGCDHEPPDEAGNTSKPSSGQRQHAGRFSGPTCWKCGAIRIDAQIGLESTPEEYVETMVGVFREVRRVLKDDGTLWLNLGSSYASQGGTGQERHWDGREKNTETQSFRRSTTGEFKPKDMIPIPWMVAMALQSDGWYLRQDIIWSKPNPMPESVRDRCTKSHEYIFLMSKSARYYFDAEAIKETASGRAPGNVRHKYVEEYERDDTELLRTKAGLTDIGPKEVRNRRSVWTVPTHPYKGAHFAVFPPDLIRPCVLAGCPEGGTILEPFLGAGTTAVVAKQEQ